MSYNKRVTVLEVADLSLPDKDTQMSPQRLKKSILQLCLLWELSVHVLELNRYEDTIEFFEAWVLMKSAEGRAVIQSMRRVGRFFNNVLCLITQSVHDAEGDDDTQALEHSLPLENNELPDILEHVGLTDNERKSGMELKI